MGSGEREEGPGWRSLQRALGMKGPRGRGGDGEEESGARRAARVRRPPLGCHPWAGTSQTPRPGQAPGSEERDSMTGT